MSVEDPRGRIVLCYDGSPSAERAIRIAPVLVGRGRTARVLYAYGRAARRWSRWRRATIRQRQWGSGRCGVARVS